MKHAYLIAAHHEFNVLRKMIAVLDHPDNDIYVHIDKKSDSFVESDWVGLTKQSRLVFTPRIDVRWGGYSQAKAFLILMREAAQSSTSYDYYHLLTGQMCPIKSQNYIHNFFERHNGLEFVPFGKDQETYQHWWRYVHLYNENLVNPRFFQRKSRTYFLAIQKALGWDHTKRFHLTARRGSAFCSLTAGAVAHVLKMEKTLDAMFKHSYIGVELYIQTAIYNSDFYQRVYNAGNMTTGNLLFTKWDVGRDGGTALSRGDLDTLLADESRLWACKFSGEDGLWLLEELHDHGRAL